MDVIEAASHRAALFDRRRARHRWFSAFSELEAAGGPIALICNNWRMDHRVSKKREDVLLQAPEFAPTPTGQDWCRQRYSNFQRTLCCPTHADPGGRRSAYLESCNQVNAIDPIGLRSREQLVHVASLNRLLRRLASGENERGSFRRRFRDLTGHTVAVVQRGRSSPGRAPNQEQVDRIAEDIASLGPPAVRKLAALVADTLLPNQPPWWACFAAEVAPEIEADDALGLCQALGMGHVSEGEWLLVWRYDVGLFRRTWPGVPLYRPTVVEANDSTCHHPSPPGVLYGIAMPLSNRSAVREVVHAPLHGPAAELACTGRLLRVASPPLAGHNGLRSLRSVHHQRLQADFGSLETQRWLDRHPPRP